MQGHTSTTWPAHFASSSAAITAPFSGPSMASVMRARPGSPPIKADSSSPVVSHVPDSPGLKAHPSIFAEAAPNGPGNTARSQSPAIRAVSGSPDFTSRAGELTVHGLCINSMAGVTQRKLDMSSKASLSQSRVQNLHLHLCGSAVAQAREPACICSSCQRSP